MDEQSNNCIIFDTEVGVCTRRASLSIRLQVDAGGTGTTGGFGSRGQETEVAAASIILCTRVTNYRWRHTKQLSSSTILLSRLASRQGMDRGWGRLGKQKHRFPEGNLGKAPHMRWMRSVRFQFGMCPPRLSVSDLGSVYL